MPRKSDPPNVGAVVFWLALARWLLCKEFVKSVGFSRETQVRAQARIPSSSIGKISGVASENSKPKALMKACLRRSYHPPEFPRICKRVPRIVGRICPRLESRQLSRLPCCWPVSCGRGASKRIDCIPSRLSSATRNSMELP